MNVFEPRFGQEPQNDVEVGEKPMNVFEVHIATEKLTPEQARQLTERLSSAGIKGHDYFLVSPYNLGEEHGKADPITGHDFRTPTTMSSEYAHSDEEAKDLVRKAIEITEELGIMGVNFEIEGMMNRKFKTHEGINVPIEYQGWRDTFDGPPTPRADDPTKLERPKRPKFETHLQWNTTLEAIAQVSLDGLVTIDESKLEKFRRNIMAEFEALVGEKPDQIVIFGEKPLAELAATDKVNIIGTKYHDEKKQLVAFQNALRDKPHTYNLAVHEQVLTVIEKGLVHSYDVV